MGIFRAFGLGLFLLILATVMPTVFFELTRTIVVVLQSSQEAFAAAGAIASHAGDLASPSH